MKKVAKRSLAAFISLVLTLSLFGCGRKGEEGGEVPAATMSEPNREADDMPDSSKPEAYVPEPQPVSSDYYIVCHYFPGWKPAVHPDLGFHTIRDYPERTPLMGYYDESNPEVTDWEIKWALEHGINCFIYCWYREHDNLGKPVTREDTFLSHQMYEGLFRARYGEMMDFAIMWEMDNYAGAKNEADLLDNLLPFWAEDYFSRPNYQKIDGKPVLYVYGGGLLSKAFGSDAKVRAAFEKCNEKMKGYGFEGIVIYYEDRGAGEKTFQTLDRVKEMGYDGTFAYCWHTDEQFPTQEQAQQYQLDKMYRRAGYDPRFSFLTASVGWDPRPWYPAQKDEMTVWKLTPENWRILLERIKGLAETLPEDAAPRRMIMLDNWNEWGEGHYIAPHLSGGFKYLQAVREVFTKRDNLPDYRLPQTLGLGPYGGAHDEVICEVP